MTDPYSILEVSRDADEQSIRSAYRKLAKKYHPDVNPGDKSAEEKFKAISKAYDILGDKEKKAQFDHGQIDGDGNPSNPFAGGGGGGFGGFGGGFRGGSAGFNVDPEDMASMFGDLFGQGGGARARGGFGGFGGGRRGPVKGADARSSLTIPFMLSVTGGSHEILIDGSPVKINIPAGIESGKVLRLKGKGQPSPMGGTSGDLLLTIHVASDSSYTREGYNLRKIQDISLADAVLGGKAEVSTPQGTVRVTIKPGSDSGAVLRLKGRGVAASKDHPAGDLLVVLQIKVGEASEGLKKLLEEERPQTTD